MTKTTNRNTNFEILRALAAFMVVSTHSTVYHWWEYTPGTFDFFIYTVFNCFGRSSVPIFFMISGAFLLQKEVSFEYMWKKAGKMLLIYLVWLGGYSLFEMKGSLIPFDINNWLDCIMNEKYHLWFMPVMIRLYLIVPILQSFVHYKDGLFVHHFVTLFFVATICRSTFQMLLPNAQLLSFFLDKAQIELCEYTAYFILGYYLLMLSQRKIKAKTAAVLFFFNLMLAIIVTFGISWHKGVITNVFSSSFTIPVFFQAIFLFIFFRESKTLFDNSVLLSTLCKHIASLSMGIYLLHIFIIEHLDGWFGINPKMCAAILAVPLSIIIYFVVTTVIVAIIKKIPIIRHLC